MARRHVALVLILLAPGLAEAATTTGSVGCAALVQAAADGATARVQADDASIAAPQSIASLSCLDGFFNGSGLNVVTSLLNPGNLLQSIKGQICNAAKQAWQSAIGSAQCGLTVSGFNLGFGGFGGGLMCPRLSFGGGGPPIFSGNTSQYSGGSGLYMNGSPTGPTGYVIPQQVR